MVSTSHKVVSMQQALAATQQNLETLLNALPDLLFRVRRDGLILEYHTGALDKLYAPPEVFLNRQMKDVLPAETAMVVMSAIERAVLTGRDTGAEYMLEMGGESQWFELSIARLGTVVKADSECIVLARDITQRKLDQARIDQLAFYDSLTGLPNRLLGHEQLRHDLDKARRQRHGLTLLCLNIDKLKFINERYGNMVGDAVLMEAARRIRQTLRTSDLVARSGGDEFNIIMPDLTQSNDVQLAVNRLLAPFQVPIHWEQHEFKVTVSAGAARYPEDAEDPDTLTRFADIAMHHAKHRGPGSFAFFDHSMNESLVRFVKTREAIYKAKERGEFELYYQPQLGLQDRRLLGFEALIRWNRPGIGVVGPDAFIPVAEETGQIEKLGLWVLDQACAQMARWQRQGMPAWTVAVNLSAVQFRHGTLVNDVLDALARHGVAPQQLKLEITESVLMHDMDEVIAAIQSWHAHGVRISLDDFGTGYSSLSYLQRFRVDQIKIDKSFVQDLHNHERKAIVQAIVQVAKALKLETVAEGVEDEATALALLALGCDQGQGYAFAKPMPVTDVEAWVRTLP